jgi:FkbM family methyltransferase
VLEPAIQHISSGLAFATTGERVGYWAASELDLVAAMTDSTDTEQAQHYSLKHRVVAWVSQRLFDNVTYTVNHGLLKGMRRRGGLGWVPQLGSSNETAEHAFFRRLDLRGKVVYDVGAFVGLFTMHCARHAARVICYEPLDRNRSRLTENILLNSLQNVTIRPFGVGRAPATLVMAFDPLMPGGASLNPAIAKGIEADSASAQHRTVVITTLDIDRAAEQLPPPDFIKIDIEGYELDALIGAANTISAYKPALYLEMHGETMGEKRQKVASIVQFLEEVGYANIHHVESDSRITSANTAAAAEGHLYCV